MKKNYYSPFADRAKIRHLYPVSKALRRFVGFLMCRKVEVSYKEELPDTPTIFCPNHARAFGPIAMDFAHKRKHRVWSVANIIRVRTIPNHLVRNLVECKNGLKCLLLYVFSALVSLPLSCFVRSYEPIPVYHDARLRQTFKKTTQTLSEGLDVVLYPEWKDRADGYKFVNQVQNGVAFAIKDYIDKTNKAINVVPVYVCQSLKKVMYGKPLLIEKIDSIKSESRRIAKYIMDEIEGMGNSLPPHEITPYDDTYKHKELNPT